MATDRQLLHDLLDETAARSPDRPAATAAGVTVSYAEVDRASRRLAVWLTERATAEVSASSCSPRPLPRRSR